MNKKEILENRISKHQIQKLLFIEQFNFKFNSAGYYTLDETWNCAHRIIEDSMFFIFFKGAAHIKIGEEEQLCGSGSVIFMPENYSQKWWVDKIDKHENIELIAVHLDPLNAWNLNLFKLFPTLFAKMDQINYWRNRFIQFVSLFNQNEELGQISGKALIKELLNSLVFNDFLINNYDVKMNPRITKALEYIHEKYKKDISVEMLADMTRLSSAQLRKIFYQELKVNPKEYIYTYRLKQSIEMLKYSNLTIKEIAYEMGFQNDHYYHTLFKKNFHITPSEFRSNYLNKNLI